MSAPVKKDKSPLPAENRQTDEELLRLVKAGDAVAAEILCERYKPLALAKARGFYLNGADKDDLIQEGMIGLYRAVLEYNAELGGSFASFADLCVSRRMMSAVQNANRKKHRVLNESVSLDHEKETNGMMMEHIADAEAADPETILLIEERRNWLYDCIRRLLTPMERRVTELFLEGRSYQEIGEALGKSVKSVDNAIYRVKRKLEAERNRG